MMQSSSIIFEWVTVHLTTNHQPPTGEVLVSLNSPIVTRNHQSHSSAFLLRPSWRHDCSLVVALAVLPSCIVYTVSWTQNIAIPTVKICRGRNQPCEKSLTVIVRLSVYRLTFDCFLIFTSYIIFQQKVHGHTSHKIGLWMLDPSQAIFLLSYFSSSFIWWKWEHIKVFVSSIVTPICRAARIFIYHINNELWIVTMITTGGSHLLLS